MSNSNNSLFGTMTMYYILKNEGYSCGHNRVYRLMSINDIKSSYRRTPRNKYTKSNAEHTAKNILNRDFNTTGLNQKWCTDVTEIKVPRTREKLFISPMIDLYDKFPVSLEVSDKNDTILANQTLDNVHTAYPKATPLIHSDREFAYTRQIYRSKLDEYDMSQSMHVFQNVLIMEYVKVFKDGLKICCLYYIRTYPQKRLNGKTCAQVRKESLEKDKFTQYPIIPEKRYKRYIRYWNEIEAMKKRQKEIIIEEIKKQLKPNWNELLIDEIFKYFHCLLD